MQRTDGERGSRNPGLAKSVHAHSSKDFERPFALLCQPDSPHIRPMAKNPNTPKKPGKTPKSKAHRPDVQPIGPALAELLNPAINRGDAGMGSGTGLRPPPDNSKDRRSGVVGWVGGWGVSPQAR
jgi:hypothetical protein